MANATTEELINQIEQLKISNKEILSIVFIGHVDAGKSTIGGQVLHLLGLIDKRTLEKYQKQASDRNRESWYLSWALDTDEGERDRGKTVEVGRAIFELQNKKIILLDAPGHSMYVSDMIDGANQADLGVLVVSARTNEFEAGFEKEGQTREHIYLCKAGGIENLLILINKMDEVNWSEERFNFIKKRLETFLSKFYSSKELMYIPISGFKGDNILERKNLTFYEGPSFLEFLNNFHVKRESDLAFSFTIIDKIKQLGTSYEGKIETGKLTKSDVLVLPHNISTTIIEIYNDDDVELDEAREGDFVRIKLKDNFDQLEIGNLIVEPSCKSFIVSDEFVCILTILDVHNIICPGYQCVLHLRLFRLECKITELATIVDKKVVKKKFAKKGEKVMAKIKVSQSLVLRDLTKPDKFALRSENLTVALGFVKKIVEKND